MAMSLGVSYDRLDLFVAERAGEGGYTAFTILSGIGLEALLVDGN